MSRFTYTVRVIVLSIYCLCCAVLAHAQGLSISGRVVDEQKLPIPSATVFISGTMYITATDLDGKFSFKGLGAGSYMITVKMLGYTPAFENVTIRESLKDLNIDLKPNTTELKEVVIGGKDPKWDEKYNLFKLCFLGSTKNGRHCNIVNPKVLRLKYDLDQHLLIGHSNDFLIIDNPELGYRIKYLIKVFEYNYKVGTTNYDGETNFEDMPGTPQQKAQWQENRRKAYYGSSMHFFRALYNNKQTPVREGFLVRGLIDRYDLVNETYNKRMRPPVAINPHPVKFDTIVTVTDNAFITLKFRRDLFINYSANGGPLEMLSIDEGGESGEVDLGDEVSILQLYDGEVVIDSRGKVAGKMPFLMAGKWGRMRIGDQLPYEYKPDKADR